MWISIICSNKNNYLGLTVQTSYNTFKSLEAMKHPSRVSVWVYSLVMSSWHLNCFFSTANGKTPASQDSPHSIFNVSVQNHLALERDTRAGFGLFTAGCERSSSRWLEAMHQVSRITSGYKVSVSAPNFDLKITTSLLFLPVRSTSSSFLIYLLTDILCHSKNLSPSGGQIAWNSHNNE